jgi:hypothetical protein
MQVEDEYVRAPRRDPIEGVSFGVDGIDQIYVGQMVNELGEAGGEQRGIFYEQYAQGRALRHGDMEARIASNDMTVCAVAYIPPREVRARAASRR